MKKVFIISFVVSFIIGCSSINGSGPLYKVHTQARVEKMPLDQALARANNRDDVIKLRSQLYTDEAFYFAHIGWEEAIEKMDARIEELEQLQDEMWERKKQQVEQQRQKELVQFEQAFKPEYKREYEHQKSIIDELTQYTAGSLKNKTSQEVKKSVDRWQSLWEHSRRKAIAYKPVDNTIELLGWEYLEDVCWSKVRELMNQSQEPDICSVESYYRVFGEPKRTQFLSAFGCYYFWYTCKDGNVQIQVDADLLDDNVVRIDNLNIF